MEKSMATNHLGPFLLTSLLMPALKATGRREGSPARVIMVSSRLQRGKAGYLNAWMRDPTLTPSEEKEKGEEGGGEGEQAWCPPYKPFLAYGTSKLANLLMVSLPTLLPLFASPLHHTSCVPIVHLTFTPPSHSLPKPLLPHPLSSSFPPSSGHPS